MTRPSNEDLYNKEPEIEGGENAAIVNAAVTAALAHYPNQDAKALDAKAVNGIGHVTVGYKTGDGAVHLIDVTVDANGVVTPGEERKGEHPGHAKDKGEHGHGHEKKGH